MRKTAALLVAAFSVSVGAAKVTDSFESNFAKARANARTGQGAAYDKALGAAFEKMPDFTPKVARCLEASPGDHSVRGYFLFLTPKDFQVVLEPRDSFTSCLSQALASPSLPVPPGAPYLNPFTFTTQP